MELHRITRGKLKSKNNCKSLSLNDTNVVGNLSMAIPFCRKRSLHIPEYLEESIVQ